MRRFALTTLLFLPVCGMAAEGPAFDCKKADGDVQTLICKDPELAALDLKLDEVYRAALSKAKKEKDTLRAEQRGWAKGRDECWKQTGAVEACVRRSYQSRTGELQALYELVPAKGPYTFDCGTEKIVVKYFHADPPIARLQRGGETVVTWSEPGAKGAKFVGQNVTFLNKGVKAQVEWRDQKLACEVQTPASAK